MLKLWNGDVLIAEQSAEDPGRVVLVNKEVQRPIDLFQNEDVTEIPVMRLVDWALKRVFPRERCGAEDLLREMGIKEYEPKVIASKTNAVLFSDNYKVTGIIGTPARRYKNMR